MNKKDLLEESLIKILCESNNIYEPNKEYTIEYLTTSGKTKQIKKTFNKQMTPPEVIMLLKSETKDFLKLV